RLGIAENAYRNTLTGASRPEWSNTWPQKRWRTRPRKCTANMQARYRAMMVGRIIVEYPGNDARRNCGAASDRSATVGWTPHANTAAHHGIAGRKGSDQPGRDIEQRESGNSSKRRARYCEGRRCVAADAKRSGRDGGESCGERP